MTLYLPNFDRNWRLRHFSAILLSGVSDLTFFLSDVEWCYSSQLDINDRQHYVNHVDVVYPKKTVDYADDYSTATFCSGVCFQIFFRSSTGWTKK